MDSFFKEYQLGWSDCVSACADGAPSMVGWKRASWVSWKIENKNISVVHRLLHRENLAAKEIQEDIVIVYKEVVSVVNLIKSRTLHTRLFRVLVLSQMVGAFTQPGPWVSLFIDFKNDRLKPKLPKRKGIHPFRCLVWVC